MDQPKIDEAALAAELSRRGHPLPRPLPVGWYGDGPRMAAELGGLVRDGKKTATASLAWSWEADATPLPHPGDVEVVVDWEGRLLAVTETTAVDVKPFRDVDEEHARREGEGDGSLESWRRAHWAFFTRECARLERTPSEDMPVVCERFRLVLGGAPEETTR